MSNDVLRNQLILRLRRFGLDESFLKELKKLNCHIAGGFMTQLILGENWEDSDINIYCFENRLSYEYEYKIISSGENMEIIMNFIQSNFGYEEISTILNYNDTFYDVITLKKNDRKIKLIDTKLKSIKEVVDAFDLDCCKVYTNGETLFYSKSIFDKKIVFKGDVKGNESLLLKYMNRGFDIVVLKHLTNDMLV